MLIKTFFVKVKLYHYIPSFLPIIYVIIYSG